MFIEVSEEIEVDPVTQLSVTVTKYGREGIKKSLF